MDRTIVTQVESAFSEVLEREVTELTAEMRLFDDLHLDSTSVMEVLMELEDSMGITFDPEELDMEDFVSVGTLVSWLGRVGPDSQLQKAGE